MENSEARFILGLEKDDPSPTEVEQKYKLKIATIKERIGKAPTELLKDKYRQERDDVESAYKILCQDLPGKPGQHPFDKYDNRPDPMDKQIDSKSEPRSGKSSIDMDQKQQEDEKEEPVSSEDPSERTSVEMDQKQQEDEKEEPVSTEDPKNWIFQQTLIQNKRKIFGIIIGGILIIILMSLFLKIGGTNKGKLYVETDPPYATVKIMNIEPKYEDGILLSPGRYEIKAIWRGFYSKTKWVNIRAGETKKITIRYEESPRKNLKDIFK